MNLDTIRSLVTGPDIIGCRDQLRSGGPINGHRASGDIVTEKHGAAATKSSIQGADLHVNRACAFEQCDGHREVCRLRRHIDVVHSASARFKVYGDAILEILLLFQEDGVVLVGADMTGRVIHVGHQPLANGLFASEVHQTARPIRALRRLAVWQERIALFTIVVNEPGVLHGQVGRVIVQRRHVGAVLQGSDEVAHQLMGENIRHDHPANGNRAHRDPEGLRHSRILRVTIHQVGGHGEPAQGQVAKFILTAKWLLADDSQDRILRRALVLGLHANVEGVDGPWGVRDYNRFGATHSERLPGIGDGNRRKIRQATIGGDVQVDIRLLARRILRVGLIHPHARDGEVRRQEREERGVRVVLADRVICEDVKVPLVGLPQGDLAGSVIDAVRAEQRRAGPHVLVLQDAAHIRLGLHEHVRDLRYQGFGHKYVRGASHLERIRYGAVAAGNDQRVILHHVVRVRRDGVYVHAPPEHGN